MSKSMSAKMVAAGKAARTLAAMAKIEGKNAAAMRQAQVLLRRLIDEPCTKDFVDQLRQYLKTKNWGITCSRCGKAAGVGWMKNEACKTGGLLYLSHGNEGKTVIHKTMTTIPDGLTLVPRPSQRKMRSTQAISKEAAKILAAMQEIKEKTSAAKAEAQALLAKLAGENCTWELVTALKKFLEDHDWGVSCPTCGQASSIMWTRRPACVDGGSLHIRHKNEFGSFSAHKTTTSMIALRLVSRKYLRNEPSKIQITDKAARVLASLATIAGTDANAMTRAQRLLRQLAGEICTESLVTAIKQYLISKGWGTRCPECGMRARFTWGRLKQCLEGGLVQFCHKMEGKFREVAHKSFSKMPRLTLKR